MDNAEKMARAQELIEEAHRLLDEINCSKNEPANSSPIAEYEEAINASTSYYYVGLRGGIMNGHGFAGSFEKNCKNPYWRFLSSDYAHIASIYHRLIDAQLAFKWCYDRDFMPDWSSANRDKAKYTIRYDHDLEKYVSDFVYAVEFPTIYFSTREIARECANWLNNESEEKEYHE